MLLCLLGLTTAAQGAYSIDGSLVDWGVRPSHDWQPDSPTANYIVTDNQNTYDVDNYWQDFYDMEAFYFDDDANFFYFAFVTKFPFAAFPLDAPPIPNTGPRSGGDLGLDFDISSWGMPNTDVGMDITEHGRVIMEGPPGNSTLGLDYGVRIGSTEYGLLGQVIAQPVWEKTTLHYFEGEGWQGGPWRMGVSPLESVIGLANIAFGMEEWSYIVEGAIPRHIFTKGATSGLVGLHISMYCGNDSSNLVASYTGVPRPAPQFFPLSLQKKIVNARRDEQQTPVVNPGDVVEYLITYANDRNTSAVTDVTLVDTLPVEVSFVGTIGGDSEGVYDPKGHTYTCKYSSLLPGASGIVRLQVQVHDDLAADTVVSNAVTIDSYETEPTATTAGVIVQYATLDPLVISKTIQSGGEVASGQELRTVDVGETITYSVCFSNPNSRVVTNVSLVDTLPAEMAFLQVAGDK